MADYIHALNVKNSKNTNELKPFASSSDTNVGFRGMIRNGNDKIKLEKQEKN